MFCCSVLVARAISGYQLMSRKMSMQCSSDLRRRRQRHTAPTTTAPATTHKIIHMCICQVCICCKEWDGLCRDPMIKLCGGCASERDWLNVNLRTLCFGKYHPMFKPTHCLCSPGVRRIYFGLLGWYLWALRNVLVHNGEISPPEAIALCTYFEEYLAEHPLAQLRTPHIKSV